MSALRVTPITFGTFSLDGGAMFGIVPKPLWSRRSAVDAANRIPLGLNSLLIEGPQFKALIDAGMGNKWDAKSEDRYDYKNQNYEDLLAKSAGIQPSEITHVFMTHLHFDHAGGLTQFSADRKEIVSTFSNAEIWIHEKNLERAENASLREKASYRPENWEILKKRGQLKTFRGKTGALLPGISFEKSDGHTEGQAVYHLDLADKSHLVFCGDLLPTRAHLDPAWGMGYDTEPLKIMDEKILLLREAARNSWKLAFPHDPRIPWSVCRSGEKSDQYHWDDEG
jgi:glyoxylase-like metal-dependent hydrolase (beta-lactamase superfamily II)